MIGSWWRSCIALSLVACIDEPPSCEAMVCELVPACSPLTTGAWDWRSESACLRTFECGADVGACLDAVEALPCLSSPPTWAEIEASTWALDAVRDACGEP